MDAELEQILEYRNNNIAWESLSNARRRDIGGGFEVDKLQLFGLGVPHKVR